MAKSDRLTSQAKIVITAPGQDRGGSFGKGIVVLLRGVAELGSLNKSAKELHMAYSKAWNMVKKAESSLGFELLERHGGGGSYLTEDGEKFLELYNEYERRVNEYSEKVFREIFADF